MALAGSLSGTSQKYSLNQLNNLLVLTLHYLNFDTELLFKFNADEFMVNEFKERVLPLLASISSLTDAQIHRYGAELSSLKESLIRKSRSVAFEQVVEPLAVSTSSEAVPIDEEGDKIRNLLAEIHLIFSDEKYRTSNPHHVWAVLAKSVFMECNLFDHRFENYCISYDVRANMIRIQFSELVIQHLASHLAFERNGNTPKPFPSEQAYISQQCFIYLIAQLHQLGHIQLASALHNMLYLAKKCSLSRGSGMSTAQLAAVFSPVFIQAFGLFNKIYTVGNGYTTEESLRIGRQYNLMSLIIANALTSDTFNYFYTHPYTLEKYDRISTSSLAVPLSLSDFSYLPDLMAGGQSLFELISSHLPREEDASRSLLTAFKELTFGKKKSSVNVPRHRVSAPELSEPSSSSTASVPVSLAPFVRSLSSEPSSSPVVSETVSFTSSPTIVSPLPLSTLSLAKDHFGDGATITRPLGQMARGRSSDGASSPRGFPPQRSSERGALKTTDRDAIPPVSGSTSSATEIELDAESEKTKTKRPGLGKHIFS
ncbi:hypothetical protein CC99x_005715 [Candidatus Berkiella cookevillensis]|uniref:Uncharacterized protein n=1 Tax=Candidatus Berkiella cookevillensis TaxID=437022 RepID=A0A0Q9YHF1_9GAMM|nr:hypothetical protein [Candidatus Berkiella cookevillensis]MCS5708400.1 hypothetical protein [Candidatus Berkiella cookevillensis]